MDLPDIKLVIQWKVTCELSILWQRFGQATCGTGQGATAILLVEKKDTDEEHVKKANQAAKQKQKKDNNIKQNLKEKTKDLKQLQHKRPTLADRGTNAQVKVEVGSNTDIGSCNDEYDNNQGPGIKATPGTLDRVGLEEC